MKGCMNCGNISCGNNKKRDCAGCGRWISPEDKIAELKKRVDNLYNSDCWASEQLTKAKELLKQWLQTSKASGCDNINIVTDTERFLEEIKEK